MAKTDFSKLTTDDLLQIIPATENREWEFKAADIFERANFGTFKGERLPKIVSSFGNSGGGQLLLGKRDGEAVFDDVPPTEGRASMEDHLSLVISQCVTPHYKDFEIFRVPINGRAGESVLVIAFEDSFAAPFQSNFGPNYYWRLPGSVQPAPHFHLELLRGRTTKAVVKIKDVQHVVTTVNQEGGRMRLNVAINVLVENTSLQSATTWGVQIKQTNQAFGWVEETVHRDVALGACVHGAPQVLLPSDQATATLRISGSIGPRWLMDDFRFVLRPLSQNFVGEPFYYPPGDRGTLIGMRDEFDRKLREYGFPGWF